MSHSCDRCKPLSLTDHDAKNFIHVAQLNTEFFDTSFLENPMGDPKADPRVSLGLKSLFRDK